MKCKDCPLKETCEHQHIEDFHCWYNKEKNENKKQYFDWQSFRVEAAKDILCSIIQSGYYGEDRIVRQSKLAVEYTDELVKQIKEQLKEKEEK